MSLLEAMFDQARREIQGRKVKGARTAGLLVKVEAVEDALSALQRDYYDVTLTSREYERIARGVVIMEAVVAGTFPRDREAELVAEVVKARPDLKVYLRG